MSNSRAITPLIATILLIGFAIATVTVVTLWSRGYVEELKEKQGEVSSSKLNCITDISVSIRSVSYDGFSNVVDITVENLKQKVDAFLVIVRGTAGQDNIELQQSLEPAELLTLQAQFSQSQVGTVEAVDVIPKLFIGPGIYEPCSTKKVSYEVE